MKKTVTILGSILGGAIVGSAITMMCCPKSGDDLRRDIQKKIIDKLNHLHKHLTEGGACNIEGGECYGEEKMK